MRKLIIATGNSDKVREIEDILSGLHIDAMSKKQVGLGELEVDEDKDTLYGNALKKGAALSEKMPGVMVLADDTGLFVDALGGKPGVQTARYAGEHCTYEDNRLKLLDEMTGTDKDERTARFITSIVLIDESGDVHHAEGICEGTISESEKGLNGFGYDAVFIPYGYTETFAELDSEIKNKISHRAIALIKLRELIERI